MTLSGCRGKSDWRKDMTTEEKANGIIADVRNEEGTNPITLPSIEDIERELK